MLALGDGGLQRRWDPPPPWLEDLAARALSTGAPVLASPSPSADAAGGRPSDGGAVAIPIPVPGESDGVLAVGLPAGATVDASDLSILVTFANHAGVALHNAHLWEDRERLRVGSLISRERNRIARELHDSVAQQLVTIGMNLEWCRRHAQTPAPVLERLVAAQELARNALVEIRGAIFELSNDGHVSLRRALRDVVAEVERGSDLRIALRSYGAESELPERTRHALVQIAREGLFNVARHARARRAWLTLRWQRSTALLTVADDGVGAPEALQRQLLCPDLSGRHLGLAGIRERVRVIGGSAAFERRRGGGVRLKVEVPLAGQIWGL